MSSLGRLKRYFRRKHVYWSLLLIFVGTIGISVWALYRAEDTARKQNELLKSQARQIIQLKRLAKQNHTTVIALCILRDGLENTISATVKQIKSSKNFLRHNPNGIDGISASVIRASIKAQQLNLANAKLSLKALDIVRCHMKGG